MKQVEQYLLVKEKHFLSHLNIITETKLFQFLITIL